MLTRIITQFLQLPANQCKLVCMLGGKFIEIRQMVPNLQKMRSAQSTLRLYHHLDRQVT